VIVVGVDGTPESVAALAFALDEGVRRDCSVEVVTTWVWGEPYEAMATGMEAARQAAEELQEVALHAAIQKFDGLPVVSRLVVEGDPGPVLVHMANRASYLVVGHSHKGPLRRALLGSVSDYCVRHSKVPVMVVPIADSASSVTSGADRVPATT
jgi:nucleotide-binding universal stress UspA family protein